MYVCGALNFKISNRNYEDHWFDEFCTDTESKNLNLCMQPFDLMSNQGSLTHLWFTFN